MEEVDRELREDAADALVLRRRVQRHHGEAQLGGYATHDAVGHGDLALVVRKVEVRQVGHERVRRQRCEDRTDATLEPHGIPVGDVVRPDRDRDHVGPKLREPGELVLHGEIDGGARDAEVHDPDGAPGHRPHLLREHAHVAAVGGGRTDALRRAVADRDVEELALELRMVPPPLGVHGQRLVQHECVGGDLRPEAAPADGRGDARRHERGGHDRRSEDSTRLHHAADGMGAR